MNCNERQNLKDKIEADLRLLKKESWDTEVQKELGKVLDKLIDISLEGYDD